VRVEVVDGGGGGGGGSSSSSSSSSSSDGEGGGGSAGGREALLADIDCGATHAGAAEDAADGAAEGSAVSPHRLHELSSWSIGSKVSLPPPPLPSLVLSGHAASLIPY